MSANKCLPAWCQAGFCWYILAILIETEVCAISKEKLLEYSMQLAWAKQLLSLCLIDKEEYRKILEDIKKHYGIVSAIST